MNVMGPENILGNSRGRGRGRARGKVGTIQYNQKPVTLIPKYRIPEPRSRLVNIAPSTSTTSNSRTPHRRVNTTSSSSARRTAPGLRNTDPNSGKGTTPASAYTDDHFLILAITTGRGQAREEVGMAVIDLQYPNMILCQMSDQNSYANALTKIHMFQPVEILMPDTMGRDQRDPNSLYNKIKSRFPDIEITEIFRVHWNASTGLERIKTHCVNQFSSIELIVNQKYYALSAVCVLFKYIESIQHIVYTQNSVKFEYQVAQNATMIDLDSAQNLELVTSHGNKQNFSLLGALDRCSTPAGRRLLRASILQPPCNEAFIKKRQDCVDELVSNKSLYAFVHPVIRRLYGTNRLLNFVTQNPKNSVKNAETIECAERNLNYVLLLKSTLDIIPELKIALKTAESKYFKETCEILKNENYDKIRDEILRVVQPDAISVNGFISSNYQRCFAVKRGISDELDVARQTYCEMIDDMEKIVDALGERYNLGLMLNCSSNLGYHIEMKLPKRIKFSVDDLPGEFIEAHVKNETLYMTTQDLFVRNQHTKDACIELHLTSNKVLMGMFEKIKEYIGCLFELNDRIAGIDLILSLAEISSIPGYVRPTFGANLEVRSGKHPVMDILGQESPIPNDIVASIAYNLHTITGPNMSGKTIYLKQIVLLQIMAQIGCFVPATSGVFRISDHIFCRIGIRDDIEFNASSFVLEIKEVQFILQSITSKSLVVLDELCRSTTVEEGASIAWAVCKKLLLSDAFTFQATHFDYLMKLSDLYPNVTNHHFEAVPNAIDRPEEARLVYTHRLMKGVQKIKNYGLMLARATGLPEEVLKDAQSIINELNGPVDDQETPQTENRPQDASKIKRNYDKLAAIYEKMNKNNGIEDEELYELVRGLESISYEEPTPPIEPPKPNETPGKSSGMYSEGPKGYSTVDSILAKSDSLKTTSRKTGVSSSQDTQGSKKLVKRQVTFSPAPEHKTKVPKLSDILNSSLPVRSPLKSIDSSDNQKNSPFKVPQVPVFLKKNLTSDPESPLFIPRSQTAEQSGKIADNTKPTSDSSSIGESPVKSPKIISNADKVFKNSGKNQNISGLSDLQALSPKPRMNKRSKLLEGIPADFHHYFSAMKPKSSTAIPLQDDRNFGNSTMQNYSQAKADAIASLPDYLRPVGDDCYFPEEYRHMRHMVKNMYKDDNQGNSVVQPNQYYFMSDVLTKDPATDDFNRGSYIHRDVSSCSSSKSLPLTASEIRNECGLPSVDAEVFDYADLIILSSDDEEDEAVFSECSMTSVEARINVQRKELQIFREIERQNSNGTNFY